MEIALTLVGMLILLALQGFFSGSEIALVNADKLHLRHRAKNGHAGSRLVLDAFRRPERLLATTLVGTNIATVSLATLATVSAIRLLGQGGDLVAFLLITPAMLIFGEVVPKSVYQQKADAIAPVVIYPLRFFSWLFFPVIWLFSTFARFAVRIVARRDVEQNLFVASEKIRTLLDSAEQAPSGEIFDHQRIRRALRFSGITAAEAMLPLSEAVVASAKLGLDEMVELVRDKGFNRLPVYDTDASRVVGVLSVSTFDLLDPGLGSRDREAFIREPMFVAPSQKIEELLPKLRAREDHMAIIVDEFGSAIGLITVEDILEEVVGDIDDIDFQLHARHEQVLEVEADGALIVDGHWPVNDMNDRLRTAISAPGVRTVAGLVILRLGHIPAGGEAITESGYRFTALDCDGRAVKTVRIEPAQR